MRPRGRRFSILSGRKQMTGIPIERSYSLQEAEGTLTSELDRLGLSYEVDVAGQFIHAARCTIREKRTGRILASGNGKGEVTESRVGSLFEATEHLMSKYHFIDPAKLFYLNSEDYSRDNSMCDQLPLVLLKSGVNAEIPFLKHNAISAQQTCFYPLALLCPEYIDFQLEPRNLRRPDLFNYVRLEQYSTNSGTAIGMNADEALIHGLLEGIERTSLSVFLSNTFLKCKEKSLRIINPLSLPPSVRDVFDRLEKEISSKVFIFEMPNKFGVPAFVSWMEQYEFEIGIAGYGCSLSAEHAILRCLYELAQYYILSRHIFGLDWLRSKAGAIRTELDRLPLHQDCAVFDMGWKCETLGSETIDFQKLPSIPFASDPHEYLDQLTALIYKSGEVPFASEIAVLGNGINVSHTFITGEDRFFNVTNCKSTFPASLKDLAP
jgi:ribosomal protein S12 methylthiotransferase accessory factor